VTGSAPRHAPPALPTAASALAASANPRRVNREKKKWGPAVSAATAPDCLVVDIAAAPTLAPAPASARASRRTEPAPTPVDDGGVILAQHVSLPDRSGAYIADIRALGHAARHGVSYRNHLLRREKGKDRESKLRDRAAVGDEGRAADMDDRDFRAPGREDARRKPGVVAARCNVQEDGPPGPHHAKSLALFLSTIGARVRAVDEDEDSRRRQTGVSSNALGCSKELLDLRLRERPDRRNRRSRIRRSTITSALGSSHVARDRSGW